MSLRIKPSQAQLQRRREYMARRRGGRRDGDGEYIRAALVMSDDGNDYLTRLVKLIPAEAVALYPFLIGNARRVADDAHQLANGGTPWWPAYYMPVFVAFLVLAVVVVLRFWATRDEVGVPDWGLVAISAVSFVLWVPVLDPSTSDTLPNAFGFFYGVEQTVGLDAAKLIPDSFKQFVPQLLLAIWTIIVPALYGSRVEINNKAEFNDAFPNDA